MNVKVDAEFLAIEGHEFQFQQPLDGFSEVLGNNFRKFEYGPPAPIGHSNNKAIIYDQHGIYLFQHHATDLIRAIAFVYEPKLDHFHLDHPFDGSLTILGQFMPQRPAKSDIPSIIIESGRQFDHVYNLELTHIDITFELMENDAVRVIEVGLERASNKSE